MPLTVELRPAVTNLKKRGDPKPRVCTMSLYLTTGVQREAQSRLTFFFMAMGPDRRTQWFFPPPNMNRIDDLITGSSVNLPETIGLWLLTHGHLTNHMDLFQTLMTGKADDSDDPAAPGSVHFATAQPRVRAGNPPSSRPRCVWGRSPFVASLLLVVRPGASTSILAPTSKATPWRTPSAKRPKGGPESHIRPLDATCVAAARCAAELRRRFSSGHGSR